MKLPPGFWYPPEHAAGRGAALVRGEVIWHMLAEVYRQLVCPCCQEAFLIAVWSIVDTSGEPDILRRVLKEPEPTHTCSTCGAHVAIFAPFVFLDRGLALLAYVATPEETESIAPQLQAALAAWDLQWGAVKPHRLRGRLALKHAILRAADFATDLALSLSAADWLQLLTFWFEEDDWDRLGCRLPLALPNEVATALADAMLQSRQERTPLQVALRAVAEQLHRRDARFRENTDPDCEELLRRQAQVVQELAAVEAETWPTALDLRLERIDRLAIRVCWAHATALRRQVQGAGAAVALAHLGLWLSDRFGTMGDRAESAFGLAMALSVAGHGEPACAWFKAAVPLYLDGLRWEEALECHIQVGDLSRARNDPDTACLWYQGGIVLAEMWRLPQHTGALAAKKALAALAAGDLSATEDAARLALASATDGSDGYPARLAALDALRKAREQALDDTGAIEVVHRMVEELRAEHDWQSYARIAHQLIQTVSRSYDWAFAEEIICGAIDHVPEHNGDDREHFQPDGIQLMSGAPSSDLRFRLLLLGAMISRASCDVQKARERFAAAATLVDENIGPQAEADLFHHWADFLGEIGEVEEAVCKHEHAISLHFDSAAKRTLYLAAAGSFLHTAHYGFLRGPEAEPEVPGYGRRIAALRAAVLFGERAAAEVSPSEISPDLRWRQCSAAALLAWLLRREAGDPAGALAQAGIALRWAQRNGEAGCIVEALEVLYSCQRHAGKLQEAAESFVQLAEVLISKTQLWPRDREAAGFLRWIENACGLPGVALKPGAPMQYFAAPPPKSKRELIGWMGNALRLPGVGVLAMLEHGPSLSRRQMRQLRGFSEGMLLGILGSLNAASPEALSWHFAELAAGGSPRAVPAHWLDRLIGAYLLLAGLARQRSTWKDDAEWGRWVRDGLLRAAEALEALGLHHLALRHCPRPPGCLQPDLPCAPWITSTDAALAEYPAIWALAAQLELQIGGVGGAMQTIEVALDWAAGRSDWNWMLRFRVLRTRCLAAINQAPAADQELALCRELLLLLPKSKNRKYLTSCVDDLGKAQQADDFKQRERELLLHAGPRREGPQGFEEEVKRLLAQARAHATFGRLRQAQVAADQACEAARQGCIGDLEREAMFAQADIAFEIGDCSRAIRALEECLAASEGMVEPDLRELGRILGTLGLFRCSWIHSQAPAFGTPEYGEGARQAAEAPVLRQAIHELERSMELHRQLGAWHDTVSNLINLGLAHAIQRDPAGSVRCYLEALLLCVGSRSGQPPTVRWPISCARIWMNLAATCDQLGWYPEAPVISHYWLTVSAELLRGMVSDDNRLRALPEREGQIPAAIERIWQWIRESPPTACQSEPQARKTDNLSQLRAEVQAICRTFGMAFGDLANPPSSGPEGARKRGNRRRPGVRRPASGDRVALHRDLFELIENSKAQVLHEQLGSFLPPPETLPASLRKREEQAQHAWSAARRKREEESDPSKLNARIELCWRAYEKLSQVWADMERHSAAAGEYASLRSGRHVDFMTIRKSL